MVDFIKDISDLPTPAAIVNENSVLKNLTKAQAHFDAHQIFLRPHVKTHKIPELARLQIGLGARGISAQKLGEAEVMADAGVDDIFLTYPIIGAEKRNRLMALKRRIKRLITVADHPDTIHGLAQSSSLSDTPLLVMIECDTGLGRCGVQTARECLDLAKQIEVSPNLRFHGLMTYPAKGGMTKVQDFMSVAKTLITTAGIDCPIISSGGTPDMYDIAKAPIVNEYRAGTYIYNDRSLIEGGQATLQDCAFTILTTVVSTPRADRAIIDAGSKTLSSDLLGMQGYGLVLGRDDLEISNLSEEHGTIRGEHHLHIGDRIRILPNHVCVVSNLLNSIWIERETGFYKTEVSARGTVT